MPMGPTGTPDLVREYTSLMTAEHGHSFEATLTLS
jgi:hypothetical protein